MHEDDICQQIFQVAPYANDWKFLQLPEISFEIPGRLGPHLCLVHEPMFANLLELKDCLKTSYMDYVFVKSVRVYVLLGLSYLHNKCNIVHTGKTLVL
jgi:serine/threonine-protein kinase SRPK3